MEKFNNNHRLSTYDTADNTLTETQTVLGLAPLPILARYTYDHIGRQTREFNTTYSYDARGNFKTLTRSGITDNSQHKSAGLIDNLVFGYKPGSNQIDQITDVGPPSFTSGGYKDAGRRTKSAGTTYQYDNNGAMIYDPSRGANHTVNHLNLPEKIEIPDSSGSVLFEYTGDGTFIRQIELRNDTVGVSRRDYIGRVEYLDGVIDYIHHDNGYVEL